MSAARALSSLILLPLALSLAACIDEENDPGALEFRTTSGGGCIGCSSNSPRFNDYGIPHFSLASLPNNDDVILRGIISPTGVYHRLDAANDELIVRNSQNQIVATGSALIGWKIWFEQGDGESVYVRIYGYRPDIASWATAAAAISGYALGYVPTEGGDPVNVCPESGFNVNDVSVTVITGETYDNDLKVVNPGMTGWVTLACRSEAVYKMKLMNYGPNDAFNGGSAPATFKQRQATLKMFTADYCGTGKSYTEQGTPVTWNNASGTVNTYPKFYLGPPLLREARFNESGATCLSNPRIVPLADVECALPSCDGPAYSTPAEWSTWVH